MFKKTITICAGILLMTVSVFAQAPQKMSYQAVVRDASNNLVTSTEVGMQISILQGSITGTPVYVETHTPTTNTNGLVSLEVGAGAIVSGNFSTINWANGPYFIKTETDPSGGTSYSISGTSQLLSVPYALYSNCVPVSVSSAGDTLYIGCHSVIIPGISDANVTTYPPGTVHCGGMVTEIVDVINPTTGKTWMDRNLGASQVAFSSTDSLSYGDLYQWGREGDGHQCRNSPTTSTISSSDQPGHGDFILATSSPLDWHTPQNDDLWQGVGGINNPCPIGYRVPTEAELNAERLSWSTNNGAGAFGSPLKLPLTGLRVAADGSFEFVDTGGRYWSSTVSGIYSRDLYFGTSTAGMQISKRADARSVRCIRD